MLKLSLYYFISLIQIKQMYEKPLVCTNLLFLVTHKMNTTFNNVILTYSFISPCSLYTYNTYAKLCDLSILECVHMYVIFNLDSCMSEFIYITFKIFFFFQCWKSVLKPISLLKCLFLQTQVQFVPSIAHFNNKRG